MKEIKELDVHYQDCDVNMGKIRHEKNHGELCSCEPKCDCTATEDVLALIEPYLEKAAMYDGLCK